MNFSISTQPLDSGRLREALLRHDAGAFVAFEGWVRNVNDGRSVTRLVYEAYEPLAVKEGSKVLEEARSRFGLLDVACVHRIGALELGDMAVWVGVVSGHRDAAFPACRYVIDEVKARVPIWKKEHYTDGVTGWVHCPAEQSSAEGAG
jgi:molybdopterin synthase catalytic subunit